MIAAIAKVLLAAVIGISGPCIQDAARARSPRAPRKEDAPIEPTQQSWVKANPGQRLPPVLLSTPTYYGTLAAVRSLGRASIPVTTAGTTRFTISGVSKYATSSLSCPAPTDTDAFIGWLEEFGKSHEKHVLLPTCDDTAWLYARYRERLNEYFYVSSSDVSAVHALLHKGLLAEHARAVGLDTARTWFPKSAEDVKQLTAQARFPVLLKAATQALFESHSKGQRVERLDDLPNAFQGFSSLRHGRALVEYDPSAARPMIQEFFPDASNAIYNISGYARDGKVWGARAGRKMLQRPRQLGVGVCFEEASLDQSLVEGLERLVTRVNFTGVFEVEFVRTATRNVLIDFNPRFYGQMGFDLARGLPLPLLAYADALAGASLAPVPDFRNIAREQPSGKVFTYGAAFKLMIHSQRLSGALSTEQAEKWLAWYAAHEGRRVDAVDDPDDVWPARIDLLQMLRYNIRHPRNFLSSIVLDR